MVSKDFHKQRKITDIFTIDVKKFDLPDGVLCINGKDWWCIIGYQVDGETIILVPIKTPKTMSQYDNNSA